MMPPLKAEFHNRPAVLLSCRIQQQDFNLAEEYQALQRQDCGAVVLFSGLVREQFQSDNTEALHALELEYYPGMTENAIVAITAQAAARFDLRAITVIHRVGLLTKGAQIVLVAVAAPHRHDAFAAAELLMDLLKNQLPIWKKAHFLTKAQWLDANDADKQALQRWLEVMT